MDGAQDAAADLPAVDSQPDTAADLAADVRVEPDSMGTPDARLPPQTCRDVRVCIHNCGNEAVCAGKCVSSAPARVRQQYEEIQGCSMGACPAQDRPCRCDQECFFGGQCFDLVEQCDEGIGDPICDVDCH
jgi:hypothetical protein